MLEILLDMAGGVTGEIHYVDAIGDAKFLYKWNADHSFLKRNVDNLDVGNSALYLLSDMAGGVTGEIHYVDAGYETKIRYFGSTDENLIQFAKERKK